eukprot:6204642-Pleurochrysis_carterae.AAC.1
MAQELVQGKTQRSNMAPAEERAYTPNIGETRAHSGSQRQDLAASLRVKPSACEQLPRIANIRMKATASSTGQE